MNSIKLSNIAITIFFIIGISFYNFSQPPTSPANGNPPAGAGPPGGNGNGPCWDPQCIPIDGGIGFLIAAGAMLGYKKIKKLNPQK